ncbi:MAG: hypothetical protein DHS20C14_22080 [Phycisphaeraceae bacterium]|nr:MAG: hypothetical protein DHS20C14_22080 [Phycisphaeraceae bacterium]
MSETPNSRDPHETPEDPDAEFDLQADEEILDRGMSATPVLRDEPLFEEPPPGARVHRRTLDGELVSGYDEPEPEDVRALEGEDPEANVWRIRERRKEIRKQIFNAGSQFILGLVIAFVSLAVVILAIFNPIRPYLIAASVIAPIGLIFFALSWRKWLGNAPYVYRLLTSLGEDAEGMLQDQRRRESARRSRRMVLAEQKRARKVQRKHRR